jgi:hypothetical protein
MHIPAFVAHVAYGEKTDRAVSFAEDDAAVDVVRGEGERGVDCYIEG